MKRLLSGTPIEPPARWAWSHRPGERKRRRHLQWLARTSREDDERMFLLLAGTLERDSSFLDIGAGAGEFLSVAVRLAPSGHHIAYEPLPTMCEMIRRRYPAVDLRQAAVGYERGESRFAFVRNGPAWSAFRDEGIQLAAKPEIEYIQVRVIKLDDDLPGSFEPRVMKIDVNGAEEAVLAGAQETLRRCRPIVLFEHGIAAKAYGTTSANIYRLLRGADLRVFDLRGNGPMDESTFVGAANRVWNFLARP